MSVTRSGPLALGHIPKYAYADDLWVVTVYYNPCRYKSRRANYDIYAASLAQSGIPLLTLECAFGDQPFELPESLGVMHVRSSSLFWQKERLLNIAASRLPRTAKYVKWDDCDVLHLNPNWAPQMVELLKTHRVVQSFETCVRLEQGNHLTETPDRVRSFASVVTQDRSTLEVNRYDAHGHTGYGWAMHREIFDKVGLYEHAVSGSADHFMAHAIYGHCGFCVENALKHDRRQIDHLRRWSDRFHALVDGSFAAVPGEIVHLWHGLHQNREYFKRMWIITELGFDPDRDLVSIPGKPLEWTPDAINKKPALVAYFTSYFENRKEDGE